MEKIKAGPDPREVWVRDRWTQLSRVVREVVNEKETTVSPEPMS